METNMRHDPEHQHYLTTGRDSQGRLIAICSLGSPQRGDRNVTVLDVEIVRDQAEARAWFERVLVERPWEARS